MKPTPDKRLGYFWLSTLVLGIIFFPVFITLFGAHTDGYYIITKKGDWLGNPEGAIIFLQGRPLLTYLTSFIGWFTNGVEAFTALRIFSFLTKIIITYLLYSFCCRIKIKLPWAMLIPFCFILLPGNIINVIWVANGFPSSISLLCGILSYLLLNDAPIKKSNLAYSAILFLASLLTYQPVAMIVFALMFIKSLFSENPSWRQTRNTIIKEIFFYVAILIGYWLLVKYFIIPFGTNILHLSGTSTNTYKMEIGSNLSMKYSLIIDLLRTSLIGTWDTVLYKNIRTEWTIIIVFWVIALGLFIVPKKSPTKGSVSITLQKTAACVILFLLSNTPSLMAVNSNSIIGYRTFLPSGFIGLSLIFYYFKYCSEALKSRRSKILNNFILGLYVVSMIVTAAWIIHQSVRNYSREYTYLDQAASQINYQKIDQIIIVFNRPGDTLIEYDLPYEFGLMATNSGHIRYIFDKYAAKFHKQPQFKEVYIDWPVFADNHSEIIDLTSLRAKDKNNYARPAKKIKVYTSGPDNEDIAVEQIGENADNPKFLFKERIGSIDNYWRIQPGTTQASFTLSFITAPEIVVGYKLGAGSFKPNGQPTGFSWRIQGSNDQKRWMDLSAKDWNTTEGNTENTSFILPNYPALKYIKFLLMKNDPKDFLIIKTLEFYSFPST